MWSMLAKTWSGLLASMGCPPLYEAENGSQALAILQHQTVDVVLMDVQMPEMDGLTATRLLRSWSLPVQPIVIALTANAFSEDGEACLAAGMNQFVSKPVSYGALHAALMQAMRERQHQP